MKKIKLQNNTYFFLEVPNGFVPDKYGALEPRNNSIYGKSDRLTYTISIDEKELKIPYRNVGTQPEIISTIEDITEENAANIVESNFTTYKDYTSDMLSKPNTLARAIDLIDNGFNTAKESLYSLIVANGLDVNKNYLILLV
jgi:hypothetical protein